MRMIIALAPYRPTRGGLLLSIFVAGTLGVLPLIVNDSYSLHFIWKIVFWATVAAAWNIAGGYAGQLSLGHAAFFGLGAYTSTLLYLNGVSPWIGMFVGGAVAAGFALILGMLTLRLQGPFFALASIAFAEVLRIVVVNWRSLTGGAEGISLPFSPGLVNMMFTSRTAYVYIMLMVLLAAFLITYVLERSWLGYSLAAMRENEEAAEALGVDTIWMKLVSIGLSAFVCAVAGTMYAHYILLIEPSTVLGIGFSIEIALMAIIGGLGTPLGPLLGAVLIVPLSEYLRAEFGGSLQGLYLLIYGAILIIMVMFMPLGLMSVLREPRATVRRLSAAFGAGTRERRRQRSGSHA